MWQMLLSLIFCIPCCVSILTIWEKQMSVLWCKRYNIGDLFWPEYLSTGGERIKAMDTLHTDQRSLAWGLGAAQRDQLSTLAKTPSLIRLYQLLLFTMPGTPVFTYGDEIGLKAGGVRDKTVESLWAAFQLVTECNLFSFPFYFKAGNFSEMVWNIEEEPKEGAVVDEAAEVREFQSWSKLANLWSKTKLSSPCFLPISLFLTFTGGEEGTGCFKELVQIPQWDARQRALSPPRRLLPSLLLCHLARFPSPVGPEREIHSGCQLGRRTRDIKALADTYRQV